MKKPLQFATAHNNLETSSSQYITYVHPKHHKVNFTDLNLIDFLIAVGQGLILAFFILNGVLFRIMPYTNFIKILGILIICSLLLIGLLCYYYFFYKNNSTVKEEEISIEQFHTQLWSRWYIKLYTGFRFIVTGKSLKLSEFIYYRRFVIVKIIRQMIRNFGWDITKYYFKLYFSNMHIFKISWNLAQIESLLYWTHPNMRDTLAEPDEFFNLKGEMIRTETKYLVGKHWVSEILLDKQLEIVDNFFCVRDIEWLDQIGIMHVERIDAEIARQYFLINQRQRKKKRFSKYYASFTHLLIHYYIILILLFPKFYKIQCAVPDTTTEKLLAELPFFDRLVEYFFFNFSAHCISFIDRNTYIKWLYKNKENTIVPAIIKEKDDYFPPIFQKKGRFIRRGFSDLRGGNVIPWKKTLRHLRTDVMFEFRSKAHVRFFKRWLYWRDEIRVFPWQAPARRVPCYYRYYIGKWDRYRTGYQIELETSGRRHFCTYRLDECGGDLMQEWWAYDDAALALKDAAVHLAFDGRLAKNEFNKDMIFWHAKRSRIYKGSYNLRYKRFDHLDWYNFKKYTFRRTYYMEHPINYILRKPRMFYNRTSFRNYHTLPEIVTYDNTALEWYVAEINSEGMFFSELYRWTYYTHLFNIHRMYKNRMDLGYRYGYSTPDRWYVKAKNYSFTDARYERTWSDRKNELLVRNTANHYREPIPIAEIHCENTEAIIYIISIFLFFIGIFLLLSRRLQVLLQGYIVWAVLIFLLFSLHIIQQYFGITVFLNHLNNYFGLLAAKYILLPLWLQYLEMDSFWNCNNLWFFVTNMCI